IGSSNVAYWCRHLLEFDGILHVNSGQGLVAPEHQLTVLCLRILLVPLRIERQERVVGGFALEFDSDVDIQVSLLRVRGYFASDLGVCVLVSPKRTLVGLGQFAPNLREVCEFWIVESKICLARLIGDRAQINGGGLRRDSQPVTL